MVQYTFSSMDSNFLHKRSSSKRLYTSITHTTILPCVAVDNCLSSILPIHTIWTISATSSTISGTI